MPLLKRPFLDVSPGAPGDGGGDRDYTSHGDSGDGDEEEREERERGIAERVYRASEVNPDRRRILDLAFHHARLGVISADPHMEGIELDQLAINAWYMALKSLRLTHGYEGSTPPTEDELALVRVIFLSDYLLTCLTHHRSRRGAIKSKERSKPWRALSPAAATATASPRVLTPNRSTTIGTLSGTSSTKMGLFTGYV